MPKRMAEAIDQRINSRYKQEKDDEYQPLIEGNEYDVKNLDDNQSRLGFDQTIDKTSMHKPRKSSLRSAGRSALSKGEK